MRALLGLLSAAAPWVLLVSSTGCAAQLAEQNQLAMELLRAKDEAAAQRAHVAELEARLVLIEKEQVSSKRAQATRDGPVLAKLDHLIRVNERVLSHTPETPASSPAPTSAPREPLMSSASPLPADDSCGEGLSPEEQLERLVRRIHGHASGWRGGLSLEQSQALRILQRRERELDARSPWQAW